ncbi:FAD-binding protein [Microbacterium sp. NPDC077663]|uniref:FAD-dependent oxidoreductase n=1 Tax=Microbacterium sp. NPDC077663 TaxID=3364189 RepID=UPI0037C64AFE
MSSCGGTDVDAWAVDVIVVGSGAAGSGATLAAASLGARVAMIEKQAVWGGSAALSAGSFWTFESMDWFERLVPLGNRAKQQKLFDDYEPAVQRIRDLGHYRAGPIPVDRGRGKSHLVDITALMGAARESAVASGGFVLNETTATELLQQDDAVVGVAARRSDGSVLAIRASAVVLATGGFQGDRELLARFIGANADRLLIRSNPGSVGDGLRLAWSVGAATSLGTSSFYGHLIPHPTSRWRPEDFRPLTQYYSTSTLAVGLHGRRFADEVDGDQALAEALSREPKARGVLIFDHYLRENDVIAEPVPGVGVGGGDRFALAQEVGARTLVAETLDELIDGLGEWGIDVAELRLTVADYIEALEGGRRWSRGVAVSPEGRAPQTPPYYALQVSPGITFPYGGIETDADGAVLSRDGRVISGLFAAGSDIGGISQGDYAGGIGPGFITGEWAGSSAARRAGVLSAHINQEEFR